MTLFRLLSRPRLQRQARPWRTRCALLLCAAALSACTLIPLSSLWALRKLDFMTLEPAHLHVLVRLPAGVQAGPETLRIAVKLRRSKASADMLEETLVLSPQPMPPGEALPAAPSSAGAGAHWVWLSMDEASARRLDALRARGAAWKAEDGKVEGRSLEINATPQFCRSAPAPMSAGQVRVSAWMRWQAGQALLPMLEDASGKDLDEKTVNEPLPACGTLAG